MKYGIWALIVVIVALVVIGIITNKKGTVDDGSAPSSTTTTTTTGAPPAGAGATTAPAPAAPPKTGGVNLSSVPDTTKLPDGRTVPLVKMPDGLRYYDIIVGTGAVVKSGQTASMQYTGTTLDGVKFDSSYDHGGTPFDFPVGGGQVIKGWDEGVPGMKVGGKRRLVIPADLGYGDAGSPPKIPGGATLLFDVDLVGVK